MPYETKKRLIGLKNSTLEARKENTDDVGVEQTPDFRFILPQCLLGASAFIDVDRYSIPLDDMSLLIAQRLTTNMIPTKLAVRPSQTHHILVRISSSNCVIESSCNFCIVVRMHQCLPTTMLEIL